MEKRLLKRIIVMLIFIFMIILWHDRVEAATMSIVASKTTVNPGEQVTITISSDCIGRVNIATTGGTLSNNSVWIEGNSQTVTLTTKSAGTITVTAQPVTLSASNGQEVSISSKSCNIQVANTSSGNTNNNNKNNNSNNEKTNNNTNSKSNVATLANLGITPNDFKGFSPSKTSYSVTVPNSVSSISIYASKGQNAQTISGIGTKNLKEGANQFNVNVTAEDGKTTKTYTISVTREAKKEDKEENPEDKEEDEQDKTQIQEKEENTIGLSNLKIDGIDLEPNFQKDIYEYSIELVEDKTSLDINTEPLFETQKIEVIGNEDLKEGENIITILVSDENGENTVTYQLTVNKSLVAKEIDNKEEVNNSRTIIIAILVIIILIVATILIIKYVRYRREVEEYNDEYFDEEDDMLNDVEDKDNKQEKEWFEDSYDDDKPKRKSRAKGKRFK